MKTVFEHKPDFTFREFAIEKTVTVPAGKLEEMLRHPLHRHEVIVESTEVMGVDGEGVYHCLLVESGGSGYARYASYVPEATALRYPTLSRLNLELAEAVDAIIAGGTSRTTEGNWTVSFDELEDMTGLCVERKPFLQETLGDMLCSRPEVADLVIEDGQFDVAYHLGFCPNCQRGTAQEGLTDGISQEEMKSSSQTDVPAGTQGMLPSM
ncbi:MAG: hypothetical protein HFH80_01260 [Lachnospiraceae bacterium]|nr:hypothetical protein [Lachnospiraceae bacterium]